MDADEQRFQSALVRDVFGPLLFRSIALNPAMSSVTAQNLAGAVYAEPNLLSGYLDSARLQILADALEDSGCTDADTLGHCRGPGLHVRGCWVVDLLLGRE